MKALLILLFFLYNIESYSQSLKNLVTEYSRVEEGSIGKESFIFNLNNSTLSMTSSAYNTRTDYGPLMLEESGYSNGLYYLFYQPDIKSDPYGFSNGKKKLKAYRFIFKSQGGAFLRVEEMIIRNNKVRTKTYFTKADFQKGKSSNSNSKNKTSNVEYDFDIDHLFSNSNSLVDLVSSINFSFNRNGSKTPSNDGKMYTIKYHNNSEVTPLVTYSVKGEIKQIVFLIPKIDADQLVKKLISEYGTSNGVIVKSSLTYDYRSEGSVGIIIAQ
jgi:hypothetical protein